MLLPFRNGRCSSQRRDMAAARIKRELAAVDSTRDQESRIIPVCSATKDEWKAYLESDDQELRWFCEWINGMVYIVQLSGEEDESFAGYFGIKFFQERDHAKYMR